MSEHLMNTYAPLPVAFTRGEGAWLWDEAGRRYLDGISGLGVVALGHAHPELTRIISEQAGTLIHTGNLVRIPWQEKLAEKLTSITGMQRAFIANSGAEAIEAALKIARLTGHQRDLAEPAVVVMENSFHGRTMAALSATGSRKAQAGFEPLVSGFVRVPFGNAEAVEKIARSNRQVVAVLVEPIQGESGVCVPEAGYLRGLRELCDENDWLLIVDEIQCGLCRSGAWYAYQHESIQPDILTTAKALANGLPAGACLARGDAAEAFTLGRHGSTFGGNPLVSRTACSVLDIMEAEALHRRAAATGRGIRDALGRRLGSDSRVLAIRGKGLMIGIELDQEANRLKQAALERGLLLNVTRDRVVRLLPPLIIDGEQAEQIVETVCKVLGELD